MALCIEPNCWAYGWFGIKWVGQQVSWAQPVLGRGPRQYSGWAASDMGSVRCGEHLGWVSQRGVQVVRHSGPRHGAARRCIAGRCYSVGHPANQVTPKWSYSARTVLHERALGFGSAQHSATGAWGGRRTRGRARVERREAFGISRSSGATARARYYNAVMGL